MYVLGVSAVHNLIQHRINIIFLWYLHKEYLEVLCFINVPLSLWPWYDRQDLPICTPSCAEINTENEKKKSPAAGPPIGMSFHAVIYGEAENTSVVGMKKKKKIRHHRIDLRLHFLSLSRDERPRAHGQVAWLCSVDSSGRLSLYNRPSATAIGLRYQQYQPC